MSDKIEMTITINELVSPLLFERLSACPTARRRAAVLKALAESALRLEMIGHVVAAPRVATPLPPPAARQAPQLRDSSAGDSEGFQVIRVGDGNLDSADFGDALHDQLGTWL
ncbi:hypothetical protein [Burkholderia sp. MSMB1498]|uniref:hypothetical protein n=1 Tax=Burkholderia sp. MSMB1498 TaxID=1637842 RepID=UPI0007536ECC|nr:hypothetical protein [Burkholderia sp. MSMB1498]KVK89423.1 hypothetical protein WS91_28605 [Burkholderia sp. MSMB1498]